MLAYAIIMSCLNKVSSARAVVLSMPGWMLIPLCSMHSGYSAHQEQGSWCSLYDLGHSKPPYSKM